MSQADWNWYAAQELAGVLRRAGLECPTCGRRSDDTSFDADALRFRCGACREEFTAGEFHERRRKIPGEGDTVLFRPVGAAELQKIEDSGFTRFPPRVQWQPIFYPVLSQEYADAIARDWNSTDPSLSFVGYVTRFRVRNEFLTQFEVQVVADRDARELWIPADQLSDLNRNIIGKIDVIAEFRRGELVRRELDAD